MRKGGISILCAVLLLAGCMAGGTLAWLSAKTQTVTNTFTVSGIDVTLQEHTYDVAKNKLTTTVTNSGVSNYKMIPGWELPKDPEAAITTGSEDCYLFVKVEKSQNFDSFMTYGIADGWTELTSAAQGNYKVYYRVYDSKDSNNKNQKGTAYGILSGNKVQVKSDLQPSAMEAETFQTPTLTFTAYAFQLYKSGTTKFTAAEAWNNVK